tara:strand:- start:364 stop:906 length:543 start_codon:yes stop_codon:yes gene_type:complete
MKSITIIDYTLNLWDTYPQMKTVLQEIYSIDADLKRRTHKDEGSRVGWALIYLLHPQSVYFSTPQKEAIGYLSKDILRSDSSDSSWDLIFQASPKFKELCLTIPQRVLLDWKTKFEERNQFLETVPYDTNTFEMLDKMLTNTKKMFDMLQQAMQDYEKDLTQGHVEGGSMESLSDKGELG